MATAHINLTAPYSLQGERFFFDSSALIFIHGPFLDPNDVRTAAYSELLARLAKENLDVFINNTVISEFVNQFIRQHHAADIAMGHPERFKDYRSSERYTEVTESLADEMYHILNGVSVITTSLVNSEIQELTDSLSGSDLDFNDMIIGRDCGNNDLVLVTHDSDFIESELRLASANIRLLRECT